MIPYTKNDFSVSYLTSQLRWLVQLRWLAISGVLFTLLIVHWIGFLFPLAYLLSVPACMVAYNGLFLLELNRPARKATLRAEERKAGLQLFMDIVALTVLIHYTGGTANPFVVVYAFPAAVGAMLLPVRDSLMLGLTAGALHGADALATYARIFPAHPLRVLSATGSSHEFNGYDSFTWTLGYLTAFFFMLAGVIYFVQSITSRYRVSEARRKARERVARSRERMSRVGEISAGVAHSIRNPLHGILHCVDHLRQEAKLPESDQELLDMTYDGLKRIEKVTQGLLKYTRETPTRRIPTDINELIQDSLHFVEVAASKKSIEIRQELGELREAQADPVKLSEAILNVVNNAIDASADGGIITVRTSPNGAQGNDLVIEISDQGQGIPPESIEIVFDPFYTTKPVGEGTGLGLAITKRILEDHGGEVRVESQEGKGTRIRLQFPSEI